MMGSIGNLSALVTPSQTALVPSFLAAQFLVHLTAFSLVGLDMQIWTVLADIKRAGNPLGAPKQTQVEIDIRLDLGNPQGERCG